MTRKRSVRRFTLLLAALLLGVPTWAHAGARLLLVAAKQEERKAGSDEIEVETMKPFDILLVAERDDERPQISTAVFTLDVPDGILVVGEEILTESLIALGTPRSGINLSFLCIEAASVEVMRFRFLVREPIDRAIVSLLPDTRTNFRGIVSCQAENYAKWDTEPSSVTISAR